MNQAVAVNEGRSGSESEIKESSRPSRGQEKPKASDNLMTRAGRDQLGLGQGKEDGSANKCLSPCTAFIGFVEHSGQATGRLSPPSPGMECGGQAKRKILQ